MSDLVANEEVVKTTVTVNIDGVAIEANPGELLIAAAERTGTFIPRFCWHPRMREVGMCRMCVVNVSGPRGMSLQPACIIGCTPDMEVDTKSAGVVKAQKGILEFLLINHPLDCPVCDKGGECPLQDQTLEFGPGESRFVEEKRHYKKPIPISENVLLDRERCVLCDRCTRFSKEVAGDPLIHFIHRGNATEVNTFPDDPFSSYFSGNVVQICPVGALTAKPYRFAARPWDLSQVESTCTTCAMGCKTTIQSSFEQVTRIQGVDSDAVNWGWMCDKGRFNYESIASSTRLTRPMLRESRLLDLEHATWGEAIAKVAARLGKLDPKEIGFLGGSRLTNEDQYAWTKFAKGVIGTDNVDVQIDANIAAQDWLNLTDAQISDLDNASAIVIIGEDVKETLPVLYLRVRDSAVNKRIPLIELSPTKTGLSKYATSLVYRAGEVAQVVGALIGATNGSPAGRQISGVESALINTAGEKLKAAIDAKKGSGKIVVIFGPTGYGDTNHAIVESVGALKSAFEQCVALGAIRRSNTRGGIELGMSPGLLPGRVSLEAGSESFTQAWGKVPQNQGYNASEMLKACVSGELRALVCIGADLSDFPDAQLANAAIEKLDFLVCVDTMSNKTNVRAHVVLPASGYGEKSGTTTNLEGRVSLLNAKVNSPGQSRADWAIASQLAQGMNADLKLTSVEQITNEIAELVPTFAGITPTALASRANEEGMVLSPTSSKLESKYSGKALVVTPDSYSLRLVLCTTLYDHGTHVQAAPSLQKLSLVAGVRLNPTEFERHGFKEGETITVLSQTGSIEALAICDPDLPRGIVQLFAGLAGANGRELIDQDMLAKEGVCKVRLESLQPNSAQANTSGTVS